ncbi:MAG: zinc ribbon domain-containing protein [Planctomycetota bacterium]
MRCKRCGHDNPLASQYCQKCGIPSNASLSDVSQAAEEDRINAAKKRNERTTLMLLILVVILVLPLLFFVWFLPEPQTATVFVAPPCTAAEIPRPASFEKMSFHASELVLPIPAAQVGSGSYIAVRAEPESRAILRQFFLPPTADWEARSPQVLGGLADASRGLTTKENSTCAVQALMMLAMLGEGQSSAADPHKAVVRASLEKWFAGTDRGLEITETAGVALMTLAFMENSLLDPSFKYAAEVPGLLARLNSFQDKTTGSWPRQLRAKVTMTPPEALLLAANVLAEASAAGRYTWTAPERKLTLEAVTRWLEEERPQKISPAGAWQRALAVYDILLINDGRMDDALRADIKSLMTVMLPTDQGLPYSVPGAYYLLLVMFRTDHTEFMRFRDNLIGRYERNFIAATNQWPALPDDAFLNINHPAAGTAWIARTYAFPYLFPKFSN